MTIGPAPMIRIDLMSLRFGIAHQPGETIEEVTDVVRPRTRLRMALETKRCPVGAGQALEGTVEERNVRRPQVLRERGGIDGEAVVLRSNDHLARVEVLHRMVRAVMAELHLHGLRA